MPVNLYCGSSFVTRSNKKLSALAITYIKQDPQRFDSPPSSATRKGESWEGARMKLYFKKIYLTVSICVCVCVTVGVCACVLYTLLRFREEKSPSVWQQAHPPLCPDNTDTHAQTPTHTLAHTVRACSRQTHTIQCRKQTLDLPICRSSKQSVH